MSLDAAAAERVLILFEPGHCSIRKICFNVVLCSTCI